MHTHLIFITLLLFSGNCLRAASTEFPGSVTVETPLVLMLAVTHPVTCYGGHDGAIALTISGGTAPYLINWYPENLPDTTIITNLYAGNYVVEVTDATGLSAENNIILDEPYPMVVALGGAALINCFGDSSGSFTVVAQGENPPFTYLWSNGQTGNSLVNAPSGTYSVTVTNSVGCTDTTILMLSDPPQIQILATVTFDTLTPVTGSIQLMAYGGNGGYTFQTSGPNNFFSTATELHNLPLGTYTVTVTDLKGCTYTEEVIIEVVNSTEPVTSNNFSISPNPANDYLNIQMMKNGPALTQIRLVSIQGSTILFLNPPSGLRQTTINVSSLPVGFYGVRVLLEDGKILEQKLVIYN